MPDQKVVSLGAVRAEISGHGNDWTPRDACEAMIKMLDAGMACDKLIICYDCPEGSGFHNATPDAMSAIGLLQVTQLEVYRKGREGIY